MSHTHHLISLQTNGQGLYEISHNISQLISESKIEIGLATLFVRHTSCSLIVQENADPDVREDLNEFFARLIPENMNWIRHTTEGPDDMPAHIKSALLNTSLSVPINNYQLTLGTWQGIYLFEHRSHSMRRDIILHLCA